MSDCSKYWEEEYGNPVIAFTDERMAYECAAKRTERQGHDEGWYDFSYSGVDEIELVIGEIGE